MATNQYDLNKTRYTHRDYESIKEDLINAIPSLTQEWTDTSESDPGIVLIKLMSMFGDTLSYNVDKIALELYLQTVTQRKNCRKVLGLLGYKMHWYRSAKVIANVRLRSNTSETGNQAHVILTPYQTIFRAGDIDYTVIGDNDDPIDISSSTQATPVKLIQGTPQTETFNSGSMTNNRYYLKSTSIDESSLKLRISNALNIDCELVNNLYLYTGNRKVFFEFDVDEYDRPYIQLAENWRDIIGSDGTINFSLNYILTRGSRGSINNNAFTDVFNGTLSGLSYTNLVITNLANNTPYGEDGTDLSAYNTPGYDPQTVDDAKRDASNYVFTHDTIVTPADYEKAAKRVTGITVSKMVDSQVVINDNLNLETLADRARDKFPTVHIEDEDVDKLVSYLVILYLGYLNFNPTYNRYYVDSGWAEDYSLAGVDDPYGYDYPGDEHGNLRGLGYYPYKITPNIEQTVRELINGLHVLTVNVDFGTLKLFPFKVKGTLNLIQPYSPPEVLQIIDNVNNALELAYYPSEHPVGERPNFIEVVNIIQDADQRIRSFDSADNIIEWAPLITDIDNTFDTTSAIIYNGLSNENFKLSVTDMSFKYKNIGVTIDSQDMESYLMPGTEGQVLNPDFPSDYGIAYLVNYSKAIGEANTLKVDIGSSTTFTCSSLDELKALCQDLSFKGYALVKTGGVEDVKLINNTGLQYVR